MQWRIQDIQGERQPYGGGANILLDKFFPKTAWKWRNFDPCFTRVLNQIPEASIYQVPTDWDKRLREVVIFDQFSPDSTAHPVQDLNGLITDRQ